MITITKCTDDVPNIIQWIKWNNSTLGYDCKLFNGHIIRVEFERVVSQPMSFNQMMEPGGIACSNEAFVDAAHVCTKDAGQVFGWK